VLLRVCVVLLRGACGCGAGSSRDDPSAALMIHKDPVWPAGSPPQTAEQQRRKRRSYTEREQRGSGDTSLSNMLLMVWSGATGR